MVVYASENGRKVVLQRCKVLDLVPTGFMLDPNQWMQKVKTCYSSVPVACGDCGFVCNTKMITHLMSKNASARGVGCPCSLKRSRSKLAFLYDSEEGRQLVLQKCLEVGVVATGFMLDKDQWPVFVKNNQSRVPVSCASCGWVSSKKTICHLMKGHGVGCFCTGGKGSSYSTEHGRLRILEKIASVAGFSACGVVLDAEAWKRGQLGASSCIDVRCDACSSVTKVQINTIVQAGWSLRCEECTFWKTESGRLRAIELCRATNFEPCQSTLDPEEWKECISSAFSKMEVRCTLCDCTCRVTIANFLTSGTAGCECEGSTVSRCEAEFSKILHRIADGVGLGVQTQVPVTKKTRALRVDFAVFQDQEPVLFFEVDGRQHVTGWYAGHQKPEIIEHDVMKEVACVEQGVPLCRVPGYLLTSKRHGSVDVESFVKRMVDEACCHGKVEVNVRCLRRSFYACELFERARRGVVNLAMFES